MLSQPETGALKSRYAEFPKSEGHLRRRAVEHPLIDLPIDIRKIAADLHFGTRPASAVLCTANSRRARVTVSKHKRKILRKSEKEP